MADEAISAFSDGAPLQAADEFVIERAGANNKISGAEILLPGNLSAWSAQKAATPGTDDADFSEGTSLPAGWTLVSTGSLANARLSHPMDTSPSNPTYNVNQDVPGALVQQMSAGGKSMFYRTFAPASGARWLAITKVTFLNAISTDDRVHFGVSKTVTPSTSTDEPDDSIWIEFRYNAANNAGGNHLTYADYFKNGGSLNGRENEQNTGYMPRSLLMYIRGDTSNHIHLGVGIEGSFFEFKDYSGGNINGNVGYLWLGTQDNNSGPAVITVTHFIRTSLTDCNPFLLAGGG